MSKWGRLTKPSDNTEDEIWRSVNLAPAKWDLSKNQLVVLMFFMLSHDKIILEKPLQT
jgi:hypothetical protein